MSNNQIERIRSNREEIARLDEELCRARMDQMEAEADLAQEQAAVNAFRMHCRLKLDDLVDTLLDLQAQKQACLTRLELLRQGFDLAWLEADDLGHKEEDLEADEGEEELILPTPTMRDKEAEKRLYRELARRFHPDLARTAVEQSYRTTIMAAVNDAYAASNLQALYDLAGELEPGEIIEMAGIESSEIRQLRQGILSARRQCRKARYQLMLLRKENSARLWSRAQSIEGQGRDWWSLVRLELGQAIDRRQTELDELQSQLDRLEQKG
jgi:hypothetical protein